MRIEIMQATNYVPDVICIKPYPLGRVGWGEGLYQNTSRAISMVSLLRLIV